MRTQWMSGFDSGRGDVDHAAACRHIGIPEDMIVPTRLDETHTGWPLKFLKRIRTDGNLDAVMEIPKVAFVGPFAHLHVCQAVMSVYYACRYRTSGPEVRKGQASLQKCLVATAIAAAEVWHAGSPLNGVLSPMGPHDALGAPEAIGTLGLLVMPSIVEDRLWYLLQHRSMEGMPTFLAFTGGIDGDPPAGFQVEHTGDMFAKHTEYAE